MMTISLSTFEATQIFPKRIVKKVIRRRKPVKFKDLLIDWTPEDGYTVQGKKERVEGIQRRLDIITESLEFRAQVQKIYEEQ